MAAWFGRSHTTDEPFGDTPTMHTPRGHDATVRTDDHEQDDHDTWPGHDPVLAEDSRRGAARRYKIALATIKERTAPGMGPTADRLDLVGRLHRKGLPHDGIDTALRALRSNDVVVALPDHEGRPAYALNDVARLRRVVEREASTDAPDRELIGRINERIQALREADDD